jgi:hypothetical protein
MSYLLLESVSKVLLENNDGLLSESGVVTTSSLVPPVQGFYGMPYFIPTKSNSSAVINNGGTLLGVPTSVLQNTRIINSNFGQAYLGIHRYVGSLAPQKASTRSVSGGTFGVTVANRYVLMTFTSQLAGLSNTVLQQPAQFNRRVQNLNLGYVNTWLKASTGGWYYLNGQPVNAQLQRDFVGTDNGTNRFTFQQSGKLASSFSYATRTD